MAKGKHANAAVNRRLNVANARIDTLVAEREEAKRRAREFEAEATRAGVLDAEVARLREQLAEGTNDRIEELNEKHDRKIAEFENRITGLADLLNKVLTRTKGEMTSDEWLKFREYYGKDLTQWNPELFNNRIQRRNSATSGAMKRHAALVNEYERQFGRPL